MPAVGDRFRAAREARGLTLSDVAEEIRIRSLYLAAIEEENWGAIGAPVYIRGFLRTYARFLGLDAEEAVAQFNATLPAQPAHELPGMGRAASNRNLSPLIWIAGIVAVLLVGLVVYNAFTLRGQSIATPGAAPSAGASPARTVRPLPRRPSRTLVVRFASASWARVTVDGSVSVEGTFPRGTTKTFHGKIALVRFGNAGGVDLTVDGKAVGKLGATGDVVERSFAL